MHMHGRKKKKHKIHQVLRSFMLSTTSELIKHRWEFIAGRKKWL